MIMHVAVAIEESKDLSFFFSFDELIGSSQAQDARINISTEKIEKGRGDFYTKR